MARVVYSDMSSMIGYGIGVGSIAVIELQSLNKIHGISRFG